MLTTEPVHPGSPGDSLVYMKSKCPALAGLALYAQMLRDTSVCGTPHLSPTAVFAERPGAGAAEAAIAGVLRSLVGVELNRMQVENQPLGSSLSLTMCTILGKFLLLPGW